MGTEFSFPQCALLPLPVFAKLVEAAFLLMQPLTL
jgi:hypothetical protein